MKEPVEEIAIRHLNGFKKGSDAKQLDHDTGEGLPIMAAEFDLCFMG